METLKRNIAIVCGGDSSEHDVSMRSAQGLYSFFDKERYNVYIVDVKGLDWHVDLQDGTTATIDKNDFSFVHNGKAVVFDYAYITIHISPAPVKSTIFSCRAAEGTSQISGVRAVASSAPRAPILSTTTRGPIESSSRT